MEREEVNMRFARRYALALLATIAVAAVAFAPPAPAQEKTLKLGGLATLEGVFAKNGEDSMRGIEMAIKEYKNTAGGYKIELIKASSDAKPDTAIRAARKLIEQDGIQILVGPLSGSEGLAMKDFAKTKPEITFINGSSAAQDTTLRDPAPNFFRFSSDGAQWSYGLGEHVYKTKGWKKVASLAEDYSFPYTQFYGFALEYCALGGKIANRFWVPLGTKDYASVIVALPQDVDAIYVVLGGADAIAFLNQYQQAGGQAKFIAGSITVDPAILTSRGKAKEALVGTPAGSPIADNWDDPSWQRFVKLYQDTFPADQRFPTPSLFAASYYIATKAALEGLNAVKGDLSNNHAELRKWLSTATIDAPIGKIRLDENRQAIAPNFITEVAERPDGSLYNKVVKVIPSVNQTLNMDRAKFMAIGPVGRDNPKCN
jgi:branched-chain amino acid transport system substrate-binding protein